MSYTAEDFLNLNTDTTLTMESLRLIYQQNQKLLEQNQKILEILHKNGELPSNEQLTLISKPNEKIENDEEYDEDDTDDELEIPVIITPNEKKDKNICMPSDYIFHKYVKQYIDANVNKLIFDIVELIENKDNDLYIELLKHPDRAKWLIDNVFPVMEKVIDEFDSEIFLNEITENELDSERIDILYFAYKNEKYIHSCYDEICEIKEDVVYSRLPYSSINDELLEHPERAKWLIDKVLPVIVAYYENFNTNDIIRLITGNELNCKYINKLYKTYQKNNNETTINLFEPFDKKLIEDNSVTLIKESKKTEPDIIRDIIKSAKIYLEIYEQAPDSLSTYINMYQK